MEPFETKFPYIMTPHVFVLQKQGQVQEVSHGHCIEYIVIQSVAIV